VSGWEIFQIWVIAFFTLALFSFMYKDNPLYKVAEHIFAGLSAGYYVGLIWDTVIVTQLWQPMIGGKWLLIIPGILGLLMFARFSTKYSWVSRTSLAFVMGVTAGIFIVSQLHGLVLPQMRATMIPAVSQLAEVKDSYESNAAVLRIIDGTTDTLAADTALTDVAGGRDSTSAIDSLQQVTPPKPTVLSDNGIEMDAAAITVQPDSSVWKTGDTVLITADFRDTTQLGFGDFYSGTVKIHGDSTEFKLANNVWDGWNGMKFTHLGGDKYRMTYEFVTQPRHIPGDYHIQVDIRRNGTMFMLTIIVIVGVIATLIYFYFSKEHTGVLGVTAKVGIWFIMISFGAHFGYTVMGRVSLLIGRVQFLIEDWIGSFRHIF